MSGFQDLISFIIDGQLVNAGVTNRAPLALQNNIAYVKKVLEDALLGSTVIARAKTVVLDAVPGMAVYWNDTTQQFELGLAAAHADPVTGAIEMNDSAFVWGLVLTKQNATLADILLFGNAEVNLSLAVDGQITPGIYYLSGSKPGYLTKQRPAVGIAICKVGQLSADGTSDVFVNAEVKDLLDAHTHLSLPLACVPAGTVVPPTAGNHHVIDAPDDTVEGWLPADHASFHGKAPYGAAFGYNIAASRLANFWPPIPLQGAYLELNRGEAPHLLGMAVPLGANQLCIIDANGIWWLTDCYGNVPWPTDYDNVTPSSYSQSFSFSDCPRPTEMSMQLYFTQPLFFNNQTAVLSLIAAPGSGLTITCAPGGTPASTGNLEINFDTQFILGASDDPGLLAVKSLDGNKLNRGPVVSSLMAGSGNVTLAGTAGLVAGQFVGDVVLTVDPGVTGTDLGASAIWLQGAREEHYADTIGIGFDPDVETSFRGRVTIPSKNDLPAGCRGVFRFLIMGTVAGTIPAGTLTLATRTLSRPGALLTPVALPLSDANLNLAMAATLTGAYQYYEADSDPLAVAAGDQILFTLERAGTDAYAGELQILDHQFQLIAPA